MRRAFLCAAVAVLAVTGGVFTAPASASPPRQCRDGDRIVHGGVNPLSVTVAHCTIIQVNVGDQGATISGPHGHLNALSSTFHGPVTTSDFAVLQMTRSTVDGSILSAGSIQITVLRSAVHGDISGRTSQLGSETVRDSHVGGSVIWNGDIASFFSVNGDRIDDDLRLTSTSTVVQHTTVGGDFLSNRNESLQTCAVHVGGSATISSFNQLGRQVALGAYAPHHGPCNTPVVVDGDVNIASNPGEVVLGNVVIHGNLICTGNAVPPAVSSQVVVDGKREGQCH